MYELPPTNFLRRSMMVNDRQVMRLARHNPGLHAARIKTQLKNLGMTRYGLWKMESRYLPHVVHPDETIEAVTYGLAGDSSAMLVATDRRVIFLDKKPLFISQDEITYDVVSGVNYNRAGVGSTVTLHSRVKDYTIQTLNEHCAQQFVSYIETRCLEHEANELLETPRARALHNWAV